MLQDNSTFLLFDLLWKNLSVFLIKNPLCPQNNIISFQKHHQLKTFLTDIEKYEMKRVMYTFLG